MWIESRPSRSWYRDISRPGHVLDITDRVRYYSLEYDEMQLLPSGNTLTFLYDHRELRFWKISLMS
jgi:hypothetical protein